MDDELAKLMAKADAIISRAGTSGARSQAWFIKGMRLRGDKKLDETKEAFEGAEKSCPASEFGALGDFILLDYVEVSEEKRLTAAKE